VIQWGGSLNVSAIVMIGHSQLVCNLMVSADSSPGWLDGIQYDGQSLAPGPAISSASKLDNVFIDCNGREGNGITLGRGRIQADQMSLDHIFVTGCMYGYGVETMDPNAVGNTMLSPTIIHCWVGYGTPEFVAPGGHMSIFGGEIDNNDVNFLVSAGTHLTVIGTRSETSKKTIHTSIGYFPQSVTFINYNMSQSYTFYASGAGLPLRPATTATTTGFDTLTLSTPNSVTFGDWIVIQGAGAGGGPLTTHIAWMDSPTSVRIDEVGIVTQVVNAQVTLATDRPQHNMYLKGGGPYLFQGSYFGEALNESTFSAPLGTLLLDGVGFYESFANPNPMGAAPTDPGLLRINWRGVWTNDDPQHPMPDRINALDRQTTTTACTTAAAAGATCTTPVPHNFGFAPNETFCTLRNAPAAQTGVPIILSVLPVDANNAVATIGSFSGAASGGGTLACWTNVQYN
jgi:hypothetical protein